MEKVALEMNSRKEHRRPWSYQVEDFQSFPSRRLSLATYYIYIYDVWRVEQRLSQKV